MGLRGIRTARSQLFIPFKLTYWNIGEVKCRKPQSLFKGFVSQVRLLLLVVFICSYSKNNLLKFIARTLEFHTLYSPQCKLVLKQYCS